MTEKLLFLAIVLIPALVQNSYAESFDFEYFTGEVFQITYELQNAELQELTHDENIKFILLSTDGTLSVSFPKAIPLEANEGLNYPLFVAYHTGGGYSPDLEKNTKFVQTVSDCTFDIEFDFNNTDEEYIVVEINHGMYPEGHQLTYVDVPAKCLEDDPRNDTEIQRKLNDKECSNSNYHKGINIRDEIVCISFDSYPWLNQRGYLKTFPIMN